MKKCKCGEEFDTEHILLKCQINKEIREERINNLSKINITPSMENLINPNIENSQWVWGIVNDIIMAHPLVDRI